MPVVYESPGSVRNQIGLSLSEIRGCISSGNLEGLVDHTRYLVVLASPYIIQSEDEEQRKKDEDAGVKKYRDDELRIPSLSSFMGKDDPEHALFEACMGVLRKLLPSLAKQGLYAYVRGDMADSDELLT